jgi:preprotein translocase subunit YajC
LRKIKILGVGVVLALTALGLSGCVAGTTTPSTDANGNVVTPSIWSSLLPMIIMIVALFALMYFFTIRPQRKKQQEAQKMLTALAVGDKVITNAGVYGVIQSATEDSFVLKVDNGSIRVAKWAVVGKQPEETAHT